MLKIENLVVAYGKRVILKGINLNLRKGILYAILGPNGSGKSTLLKSITKHVKIEKGKISLDGMNLNSLSQNEIAKKIAYLPQITNSLPEATVFDTILLGRKPHFSFEPTMRDLEIVEKIIYEFNLSSYAFKKINELSGGEVQKILIARALTQQPEVLLLDEPVNHLDPKNQIEILQIIKELTREQKLVSIIVLHDINLALHFADHFIFIKDGQIQKEGDIQIIEPSLIQEIYEVNAKIFEINGRKNNAVREVASVSQNISRISS
ncbi:MAG: ABC transporter ATP-binding protein [Caldimicrobium sp.]